MSVEIVFPVEFLVPGTPPSHQSARRVVLDAWKQTLRQASLSVLPEGHFATDAPVAVTVYHFTDGPGRGDLDNIVKPILDALCQHIYLDDSQVARLVIQRFDPDDRIRFAAPTPVLQWAQDSDPPFLYVRVSDQPLQEVRA